MSDKTPVGKIKRVLNSSEVHFNGSGEFCFDYHCGENLNSILRKICAVIGEKLSSIEKITFENGVIRLYIEGGVVYETSDLDERYYTKDEVDQLLENFSSTFIDLEDTPSSYTGAGGKLVAVKQTEDGVEFIDAPQGFSGDYNDLTNKPDLQTVALTGDYNDLINRPTIDGEEGIKVIQPTSPTSNDFMIQTEFTSNLDDSLGTVAVGGLPATTVGALKGQSLRKIIEDMVAPTLNPTLTAPSITSFTRTPSTSSYEIGSSQTFSFTANFSRGSINPQYSATSPFRSGAPNSYIYTGQGLVGTITSTSTSNTRSGISVTIASGTNTWTVAVAYDSGVQPYNNKGGLFSTPLSAGTTGTTSNTLTGIYPYFYYKSSSPITASSMKTAIESGLATKVVSAANGTITIPFAATGEYIAVAYHNSYTTKTIWYVNALDNGAIPGGVFGSAQLISINSPDGFWSNQSFKIHVSPGLITQSNPIELRNS